MTFTYNLSVLDVLPLIQVINPKWKNQIVRSSLVFEQTIDLSPIYQSVSDTLNLVSTINSPNRLGVSDFLNVLGGARVQKSQSLFVHHYLSFGSHQWRGIYQNVNHTITFTQLMPHFVGSELTLTQTVICHKVLPVENHLDLTDTTIVNIVQFIEIDDQLDLFSAIFGFIPTDKYINDNIPTLTRQTFITLIDANHVTLKIRNPEFDNIDKLEHARVNKKTRGGNIIIFRDPTWPFTETFSYKFKALTQSKVKSLLDFVNNNLGARVTLIDYEGQRWEGIITNPELEVVETSLNSFETGFDFEVILPVQQVGHDLLVNQGFIHA